MDITKGTVGWLLNNALAIDIETSINTGEIKSWATAMFDTEEEIVTEDAFGDNAEALKEIIRLTTQNNGLIVGHNIREHDLNTLFCKETELKDVLRLTWDTYLIEQCLNPLRASYALDTTHIPQDDAKLSFELFIRQAIVISQDIVLFDRMRPVLPFSFKGRPKVRASFPIIFNNVNGEERESFFLRKRDIPEILKNETKTISPEEKTLIIAPELLWDSLSRDDLRPLFIRTKDTGLIDRFSAVRITEPENNCNEPGSTIAKSILSLPFINPFNRIYVNQQILEIIKEFTVEQSIDDLVESCYNANVFCVAPSSVRDSYDHFSNILKQFAPDKVIVLWPELDTEFNQDISLFNVCVPEAIIDVRPFPPHLETLRDSSIKNSLVFSALERIKSKKSHKPKALICSESVKSALRNVSMGELDYVSSPDDRTDRRLVFCKDKHKSFTAITYEEILRRKTTYNINVDYVLMPGSIPEYLNAEGRAFFRQELLTACGNNCKGAIDECLSLSDNEANAVKTRLEEYYTFASENLISHNAPNQFQKDCIQRIVDINHRVCLIEAPTGSGKSVIFQTPILFDAKECLEKERPIRPSIIITPLVALMDDQVKDIVDKLDNTKGELSKKLAQTIKCINAGTDDPTREQIWKDYDAGKISMLYMAPERLRYGIEAHLRKNPPARFVFDETHCITEWGEGFRPDYVWAARRVAEYKYQFTGCQVILLSATVSEPVHSGLVDIFGELDEIRFPYDDKPQKVFIHKFIKLPNNQNKEAAWDAKYNALVQEYNDKNLIHPRELDNGFLLSRLLVFTKEREEAECDAERWGKETECELETSFYHARCSVKDKTERLKRYKVVAQVSHNDSIKPIATLFATKAFGMGIDIPNIHSVALLGLPDSVEDYVQQIGRSARDLGIYKRIDKNEYRNIFNNDSEDVIVPTVCIYDETDVSRLSESNEIPSEEEISRFLASLLKWKNDKVGDKVTAFLLSTSEIWQDFSEKGFRILNILSDKNGYNRIIAGKYSCNELYLRLLNPDVERLSVKEVNLYNYLKRRANNEGYVTSLTINELIKDETLGIRNLYELVQLLENHLVYARLNYCLKSSDNCQSYQAMNIEVLRQITSKLEINSLISDDELIEFRQRPPFLTNGFITEYLSSMVSEYESETVINQLMRMLPTQNNQVKEIYEFEGHDKPLFWSCLGILIYLNIWNIVGRSQDSIEVMILDNPIGGKDTDKVAEERLKGIKEVYKKKKQKMLELAKCGDNTNDIQQRINEYMGNTR